MMYTIRKGITTGGGVSFIHISYISETFIDSHLHEETSKGMRIGKKTRTKVFHKNVSQGYN